jgi:hypothetical protein
MLSVVSPASSDERSRSMYCESETGVLIPPFDSAQGDGVFLDLNSPHQRKLYRLYERTRA